MAVLIAIFATTCCSRC